MKKFGFAATVVSGLAAALIGLAAPAAAAPTGTNDAEQTIGQLRAQGYTVIVNRLGSSPLNEADVVGIRQGQTFRHIDAGSPLIGSSDNYTTVEDRIVYVDVK